MGKDKKRPASTVDAVDGVIAAVPKAEKPAKPPKAEKPAKPPKAGKPGLPDRKGVERAIRQLERRVAEATKAEVKLTRQLDIAAGRRARLVDQLTALTRLAAGDVPEA